MVKVGSIGLATLMENPCSKRRKSCAWLYTAPEAFKSGAVLPSDVWSLGMSVIEMAEGKHPFANLTPAQVVKRVCEGEPPCLTSLCWSLSLRVFVSRCLVKDITGRASVKELLRVVLSLLCYE